MTLREKFHARQHLPDSGEAGRILSQVISRVFDSSGGDGKNIFFSPSGCRVSQLRGRPALAVHEFVRFRYDFRLLSRSFLRRLSLYQ